MHPTIRFRQIFLLSAVAFGSASAFNGEGTVYGLTDPSGGNCNFIAYPDYATSNYAAINEAQWDSTMNCGRCAQVKCTDEKCVNRSKVSEVVYIVDQCPGCNDGDLDLSPTVFKAITGMEYTRLQIEWEFVNCPILGNIKYCLKKGSNSFWAAIQPTHVAVGVASVTIDDKPTSMVASSYYFLLDGNSNEKSDLSHLKITMTSVTGEVVEDVLSFTDGDCVEGTSQFTEGASASVSISTENSSAYPTQAPTEAPTEVLRETLVEAPTKAPTEALTEVSTGTPSTSQPPPNAPTKTTASRPATSAPTETPTMAPSTAPLTTRPSTDASTSSSTTAPLETSLSTSVPTDAPSVASATTTAPTAASSTVSPTTSAPPTEESFTPPPPPPTSVPARNTADETSSPSISSPSADSAESVTNRSSDSSGPTIVVSVLAVLGGLFIVVIFVIFIVIKKKKQLNAQLEQEKQPAHSELSRYSSENDYHTNAAVDKQIDFTYTTAATPCSTNI